jgi:hypothetical protein
VSQGTLFASRFLENHAGSLVKDPIAALIELVANAWDAGATNVRIQWPDEEHGTAFSIADDGQGMTTGEFEQRWRMLDYDQIPHPPDQRSLTGSVAMRCYRSRTLSRG